MPSKVQPSKVTPFPDPFSSNRIKPVDGTQNPLSTVLSVVNDLVSPLIRAIAGIFLPGGCWLSQKIKSVFPDNNPRLRPATYGFQPAGGRMCTHKLFMAPSGQKSPANTSDSSLQSQLRQSSAVDRTRLTTQQQQLAGNQTADNGMGVSASGIREFDFPQWDNKSPGSFDPTTVFPVSRS